MAESMSGAASSAGSEGSSVTALDAAMLRADADMSVHERAFQNGVWGVLYTVAKDQTEIPLWFVFLRYFMEFWQLLLLTVGPQYGFDIKPKATWWKVVGFIQLTDFFAARGYTFFIIVLYLMLVGLLVTIALALWVAYSFRHNNFSVMWPVNLLRDTCTLFFQVLDVASMMVFLIAMDCQYFDIHAPAERYHNAEFPSVSCWKMPHLIHVAAGALSLVLFVIMAALFQLGMMDLNLATRNYMAMAHSRVEVHAFLIKVFMTCATVFVNNIKWLSIIQLVCATMLVVMYARWVPHYHNVTNHIRVAVYAAVFWSSICLTVLAYHFTADWNNSSARKHFQHTVTNAMWFGLAPAAILGATVSWLRLRHWHVTVINRFKNATATTKPKEICVFTDSRQVEIVARCCRVFIDVDDNLDPEAVKMGEMVIQMGLVQLPKDPFMIILYSCFLIDVQQAYQAGYTQLQTAKKLDSSLLERFAVFTREQQHTQKSSGGRTGAMDLVAYVEFQRNYSLVVKAHREVLLTMRAFWMQLVHQKVPFEALSRAVQNMDIAISTADKLYRMVLVRHTNNVKMLRMYAKFLEHVKHDPWGAAKWFADADKAETAEEEAKENGVLQNLQLDPELRDAFLTSRPAGGGTGENCGTSGGVGVILMNAFGIVQMTNDVLNCMLGYSKKELHGKSVNVIIPPPFSEQHNSYLRTHVTTGRMVIQGRINHMLALHRDGQFIPIVLKVTRVSGAGEDAMFLGMMEEIPTQRNTATLWVLSNGNVMSGDAAYSDLCAFKASEVAGMPLTALVKDAKEILGVLKDAREAHQGQSIEKDQSPNASGKTPSNPATPRSRRNSILKMPEDRSLHRSTTEKMAAAQQAKAAETSGPSVATLSKIVSRRNSRWDAARVTESKDAVTGRSVSWTVTNTQVNHKYAESVHVTITIVNGGIGSHLFHVIKMERSRPPAPLFAAAAAATPRAVAVATSFLQKLGGNVEPVTAVPKPLPPNYMLVADSKGRIAHVTDALATRLGTTARMMTNNAPHALESLLMEPISQLHGKHVAAAPPTAFPPYSCRAGLAVLLMHRSAPGKGMDDLGLDASDGRGNVFVPFRMTLKKTTIDEQLHHVIAFTEVHPTEAMGERRLLVSIDQTGTIKRASRRTPRTLFGFKPSTLVGRNISSIVDVLKPGGPTDHKPSAVLAEMALRSVEAPGISWRVGVQAPAEKGDRSKEDTLADRLNPRNTKAAVLRMFVHSPEEQMHRFAQLPRQYGFDGEDDEEIEELEDAGETQANGSGHHQKVPDQLTVPGSAPSAEGAAIVTAEDDDALDHAVAYMSKANGLGKSMMEHADVTLDPADIEDANVTIDVELWRADMLMGFLQLDAQGAITSGSTTWDNMLYDAGLVLGIDPGGFEGMHVSSMIPSMKGKTVNELFNPQMSQPFGAAKKRGALKSSSKSADASRLGPAHVLEGVHTADGGTLSLVAQAIRRGSGCWLVLRPHQPRCGRQNFQSQIMAASVAEEEKPSGLSPSPTGHRQDSSRSHRLTMQVSRLGFRSTHMSSQEGGEQAEEPGATSEGGDAQGGSQDEVNQASQDGGDAAGDAAERATVATSVAADGLMMSRPPLSRRHDSITAWIQSGGKVYPFAPEPPPEAHHNEPQATLGRAYSKQASRKRASFEAPNGLPSLGGGTSFGGGPMSASDHDHSSDEDKTAAEGKDNDDGAAVSQLDDAEAVGHTVDDQDYKRGQRFKKLMRLLNNPLLAGIRSRFYSHTMILVLALLVTHIGLFILFYILLKQQATYVHLLNEIGRTATVAADVAIASRDVQLIMTKQTAKHLVNLTGRSDLPAMLEELDYKSLLFMNMHAGAYLGYDGKTTRMPVDYGLLDLWETPGNNATNETQYYSVYANETAGNMTIASIVTGTQLLPLFRAGNRFAGRAMDIAQVGLAYEASKGDLYKWPQLMYVTTNFDGLIAPCYLKTMDAMVKYVIDLAHQVNNAQLMILAAEGVALCLVSVMYMIYISTKLARHRHNMYSVFMTVPMSVVRQLATKRMNLTEEDDEEDDGDLVAAKNAANATALSVPIALAGGAAAAGAVPNGKLAKSQSVKGGKPVADKPRGFWGRLTSCLPRFQFRSSKVAPEKQKRQLVRSLRQTVVLVCMFVVWGMLVIVINAFGHHYLREIDKPIATFNIVNFVCVLYMRNIFYVQELCAMYPKDAVAVAAYRSFFITKLNELKTEYLVMIYGNKVAPADVRDNDHFGPVKTGIADNLEKGADLLFWARDKCMARDPRACPDKNDDLYKVVMYGVNQMFVRFLDMGTNIQRLKGTDPSLIGPEFNFYWNTRTHMMGGFDQLSTVYEHYVMSVYGQVRLMHIALLCLTLATFIVFVFIILKPFMRQAGAEPRRIAELLSQLPPEMDIESALQMRLLGISPSRASGLASLQDQNTPATGVEKSAISFPGSEASSAEPAKLANGKA